jgi:adenylosuccinate synthase
MNTVVVDLGFGDSGKGALVDRLCRTRPVSLVIRYNGGAQAAHNVVEPGGRHHTFSQWGSGTLAGVPTLLSRFMVFDPTWAWSEADHLEEIGVPDPWDGLYVDREALMTTPWHRAVNRSLEMKRGEDRHGSCGVGVGMARSYAIQYPDDAPRVGDLASHKTLKRKFELLEAWAAVEHGAFDYGGTDGMEMPDLDEVIDEYGGIGYHHLNVVDRDFARTYIENGHTVFEGAQGVLLDEDWGFHPYNTWTDCTGRNVANLLRDADRPGVLDPETQWIGVIRSYMTRHGAGPFPTEIKVFTEETSILADEAHNETGSWQGPWRVGWPDFVLWRYAIAAAERVDSIAITHMDRIASIEHAADDYLVDGVCTHELPPAKRDGVVTQMLEESTPILFDVEPQITSAEFIAGFEQRLGVPVTMVSRGPTASGWLDRRPAPLRVDR